MLPKELVKETAGGVERKERAADPGVVDGDVHGGLESVRSQLAVQLFQLQRQPGLYIHSLVKVLEPVCAPLPFGWGVTWESVQQVASKVQPARLKSDT